MAAERSVRAGTFGPPLVAVHTWPGEVVHYADLSAAMGGRAIYSILPPVPGEDPMPRRVEDWVDHHEAVLAGLNVAPPYRFIGWSFGGVVALEMARRLRDRGTRVAFVGMIDTIRPRLFPLSTREFVWYHLGAAADLPDAARLTYLGEKARFLAARKFPRTAAARHNLLVRFGYRSAPVLKGPANPADPLKVSVHVAYLNYRGVAVPFPVQLFATEASLARAREPVLRWLPWLHGGYELTQIAGGHDTLFDADHVGALADALSAACDRAA